MEQINSLKSLLDHIEQLTKNEDKVSLRHILTVVGMNSFAPVLLVAGLITLFPLIGDIPGVPTLMAILVVMTGTQLLIGRKYFWLPNWMLKFSIHYRKLQKGIQWMYKPARFIDRITKPRWFVFVNPVAIYFISVICVLIALIMPFLEVIPFSANGAGVALVAFALAMLREDGLLAFIGMSSALVTFGVLISQFIF